MTLYRHEGETQRAFVERTLREDGRISAHEAMFDLRYANSGSCSITRLAPIVEELRKAGWDIETQTQPGEQATYRLRGRIFAGRPVGRVRECPSCRRQHPVGTTCALVTA